MRWRTRVSETILALMPLEPAFASLDTFTQPQFAQFAGERAERGDLHRYELLNGRIIMNPPAGWPHGEEAVNMSFLLKKYALARKAGRVFDSSQGFELPSGDTVAPDVSFVSHKRWKTFEPPEPGEVLRGVPDLVIELHSPSTRKMELGEKRVMYELNGVLEYWLVDPSAQKITVLSLQSGRFEVADRFLKGFRVPFAQVFATIA